MVVGGGTTSDLSGEPGDPEPPELQRQTSGCGGSRVPTGSGVWGGLLTGRSGTKAGGVLLGLEESGPWALAVGSWAQVSHEVPQPSGFSTTAPAGDGAAQHPWGQLSATAAASGPLNVAPCTQPAWKATGTHLEPPGRGDPVPVHCRSHPLALPRPGDGPGPPRAGPKPAGGGHHVSQEQGDLLLTHGTRVLEENTLG